jgi:hypothetical protein
MYNKGKGEIMTSSSDSKPFFAIEPVNGYLLGEESFKDKGKHPLKSGRSSMSTDGGCFIAFMSVFVIAGILVATLAISSIYESYNLQFYSATTNAIVTNRESELDNDYDSNSTQMIYYVTFDYSVNNVPYSKRQTVSEEFYNSTTIEQNLSVYYSTQDPSIASLFGANWVLPIFLVIFAIIWNLFVWAVVWAIYEEKRVKKALSKDGKWLYGKIIEIRGHTNDDGDYSIIGKYQFVSPIDNKVIKEGFASQRNDLKAMTLPPLGTVVKIKFLNNKTYKVL